MQNWNIPTNRAQRVDEKIGVICLYSQNYDHENAKSGSSSFVFSADDSKVSLKILAKYLGASERFDLVLSESAMECWILIVIRKLLILEDARC